MQSESNLIDSDDDNEMAFDSKPTVPDQVKPVTASSKSNLSAADEEGEESKHKSISETNLRFEDFEIISLLGEGSFGKVFKVRKIDSGVVYAMKSMSKKTLISNNQVRYAVTEAQIMK